MILLGDIILNEIMINKYTLNNKEVIIYGHVSKKKNEGRKEKK
jgi:hypothetical protein